MFKEEREQSQFDWSMLGDLKEGRPNLGPMTHVAVYRLMQFTLRDILIRDFGVEKADRAFFEAGKKAGQEYYKNILTQKQELNDFFADVQRTMKELNIGIFRVESADLERGSFVVTVDEDLDCWQPLFHPFHIGSPWRTCPAGPARRQGRKPVSLGERHDPDCTATRWRLRWRPPK